MMMMMMIVLVNNRIKIPIHCVWRSILNIKRSTVSCMCIHVNFGTWKALSDIGSCSKKGNCRCQRCLASSITSRRDQEWDAAMNILENYVTANATNAQRPKSTWCEFGRAHNLQSQWQGFLQQTDSLSPCTFRKCMWCTRKTAELNLGRQWPCG